MMKMMITSAATAPDCAAKSCARSLTIGISGSMVRFASAPVQKGKTQKRTFSTLTGAGKPDKLLRAKKWYTAPAQNTAGSSLPTQIDTSSGSSVDDPVERSGGSDTSATCTNTPTNTTQYKTAGEVVL